MTSTTLISVTPSEAKEVKFLVDVFDETGETVAIATIL